MNRKMNILQFHKSTNYYEQKIVCVWNVEQYGCDRNGKQQQNTQNV